MEASDDVVLTVKNLDAVEIFRGLTGTKSKHLIFKFLLGQLSFSLVHEMFEKAPEKLRTLSLMLIEHVTSNEEDARQPLLEASVLDDLDGLSRCIQWAKSQRNEESSQLLTTMGVVSSCASLLKILTFTNFFQFGTKAKAFKDSVVSEEFVERSVLLVTHLLNFNFLTLGGSKGVVKEEGRGSGAVTSASTPTRNKGAKGKAAASEVIYHKTVAELVS